MRSPQAFPLSDFEDYSGTGVSLFMYRMAQTWDKAARSTLLCNNAAGELIPLLIGRWELICEGCQHASEEAACVLCDSKEPRATTQQTCCDRALKRVWSAIQSQAGSNRGWG